ncbi:ECF-type sigma factor [Streptosporangium sp. OZ121]|uniref:ECF-type sigma factor n=1 Tax=Streptosporangium sp. OZ121 TaxID=3444183 RepID=UPI003F7A6EE8
MSAILEGTLFEAATDVIDEVLAERRPSALAILQALNDAGYVLLPPAKRKSPEWLPVGASSMDKVRRCAEVLASGLSNEAAAMELGVSVRTVERHAAAARALGLLQRGRRRR